MSDDFKGLKALFRNRFGDDRCASLQNVFEVVSELDPLRDGSKYCTSTREQFVEHKRVAVPDVFLRWDTIILIIEAKFFTYPSAEDLENQVSLQKKAIKLVLNSTAYVNCDIHFALLTIPLVSIDDFNDKTIHLFTWDDIMLLLGKAFEQKRSSDVDYCFSTINTSIERARPASSKVNFDTYRELSGLLEDLSKLIAKGKIYFGFSEGLEKLRTMSMQELENRDHYKVSKEQPTNNWYPIDLLISRIVELRELQGKC